MNTNTLNFDRQQQLRKVAILVATLDESMAERLLADLPAREAAEVEQIVAQLGDVDPLEYSEVVADFRESLSTPPSPASQVEPSTFELPSQRISDEDFGGVELDESLLARLESEENLNTQPALTNSSNTWQTLHRTEVSTLVEMLSAEQPQTIAVVLSRLEASQAAELLKQFSSSLQTEILSRLADLDPADEQALQVVESQLASWIQQQRQRQQRMSAGRELVQRILQNTSDSQRAVMLSRLNEQNPTLAADLSSPNPTTQTLQSAPASVAEAYRLPSAPKLISQSTPPPLFTETRTEIQPDDSLSTDDPLSQLEALDDQSLLKALRLTERDTVMLALAGANESLIKRIVRGLPRRRANQFRQQLRSLGPTRLSDMLAAQRKLLRSAHN